MEIKKHFFSLIMESFLCVCLVACASNDISQEPFLKILQMSFVGTEKAQTFVVNVQSNVEWKANVSSSDAWCRTTQTSDALTIHLDSNEHPQSRQTIVTVTAESLKEEIMVQQLGEAPDILFEKERIDLNYRDTTIRVKVLSNVDYEVVIPEESDWIGSQIDARNRGMVESVRTFKVLANPSDEIRFSNIFFKSVGGEELERSLMIRQDFRDKTYNPGDTEGLGDILIPIERGEANQEQSGEGIDKSFDGDASTWYHSPWYSTSLPVQLDYIFAAPQEVDYFVYKPRASGDNGNFGKFDLYVSTVSNVNYTKVASYDFKHSSMATRIDFEEAFNDVLSFRFIVNGGKGDLVSCGEMEFYRQAAPIVGMEEVFADDLCSVLKPDVTQRKIDGIENPFFRNIAQSLFDKTYDLTYRVQAYEPYREIDDLAREMKTSGYNPFENPTGIWFADGEEAIVMLGDTKGEAIQLKVYDFDATRRGESGVPSPQYYPLQQGLNKLRIQHGGLVYVSYYTPNWQTAENVKVHIASGKVNGFFDKNRNKADEWEKILAATTYGCLDIKGDYINLVYGVNNLREYCKDGLKLIDDYDKITRLEHELMGLYKYNHVPKNHMLARVVNDGLFADGWGAGFGEWAMDELANPDKAITDGVWCIAHELGHVNQIRPGLKWVSTTVVTNNIYSVCARYKYNRGDLNLEQERVNDGDGNNVLGGRFNSYLNYGIVKGEQWLCQRGQDKMTDYQNGGDHFVKLCPLWQLLLYYREIAGKIDWYGDVAEIVRNTDESNLSNGRLQLNFMRNTCDVVHEDLTDFFVKAGMLKPIDKELDDYSRGQLTITQADCDALIAYASKYPKPATPVLHYLTANSEKAFKKRLAVEGVYNEGVKTRSNDCLVVNHDVWKNVVVFETYRGDELTHVAMVGTDSPLLNTTLVRYPNGSTRVEAVAWDGVRTLVYGER